MRNKAAAITRKVLEVAASLGIGYAVGRAHQHAVDEGRMGALRNSHMGALRGVADYLRRKERSRDDA